MTPFLVTGIWDLGCRSFRFGMEELEFSTRFSLKTTLLARMGLLAVLHLCILLGASCPNLRRSGLFLLLPYCTTIAIALPLCRRLHAHRSELCVTAAAGAVSCGVWIMRACAVQISAAAAGLLLAAELFIILGNLVRLTRKTEELSWNYR